MAGFKDKLAGNLFDPTQGLSHGSLLMAFAIGTTTVALAVCGLRFWLLVRRQVALKADDWVLLAAMVAGIVAMVFNSIEGSTSDQSNLALQLDVQGLPWHILSSSLARTAVALFLIRETTGRLRGWKTGLYTYIGVMAAFALTFMLVINLQCQPIDRLWRPFSDDGTCLDAEVRKGLDYALAVLSLVFWMALGLSILFVVQLLKITPAKQWSFFVCAGLCAVAGLFAVGRSYLIPRLWWYAFYRTDTAGAAIIVSFEQNVGLIAASLLPLGPALSKNADGTAQESSSDNLVKLQDLGGLAGSARSSLDNDAESGVEKPAKAKLFMAGLTRTLSVGSGSSSSKQSQTTKLSRESRWPQGIMRKTSIQVISDRASAYQMAPAAQNVFPEGQQDWPGSSSGTSKP